MRFPYFFPKLHVWTNQLKQTVRLVCLPPLLTLFMVMRTLVTGVGFFETGTCWSRQVLSCSSSMWSFQTLTLLLTPSPLSR